MGHLEHAHERGDEDEGAPRGVFPQKDNDFLALAEAHGHVVDGLDDAAGRGDRPAELHQLKLVLDGQRPGGGFQRFENRERIEMHRKRRLRARELFRWRANRRDARAQDDVRLLDERPERSGQRAFVDDERGGSQARGRGRLPVVERRTHRCVRPGEHGDS